jgi:hypothetical protein
VNTPILGALHLPRQTSATRPSRTEIPVNDLGVDDLPRWTTSTFFGDFTLDPDWHQVGHHVTTVRWQRGRMVPVAVEAEQHVS